ncbi:YHS domain-containing protein [Tundrisphaera sp. TA3]|uniref:YHS domain-containing protein n=1 Tax=Tundrisphaera sp. TA3 TaxID=3435775 RepID=UPI003EBF6B00
MRTGIAGLGLAAILIGGAWAGPVDEIPRPFAPFEHMVGSWKGTATPAANRFKGWQETHGWAWKFDKGVPVGMTVAFEGDKAIAKGQLAYDAASKTYTLDGTDAEGKPAKFAGSFSPDGKVLTLNRAVPGSKANERLVLRPNSNKIRYTLELKRQEPGAPQFKDVFSVGLTKEGESFAAGGNAASLPQCILTGGAATMTVSYQGKSYPVCCSGCRDEFNDNPEKYVAKVAAQAKDDKGKPADKPASSKGDDGSFDGLLGEPKARAKPKR